MSEQNKELQKNRLFKHPVPSKYLEKIGDITVSFALLEHTIESVIWSLIDPNQRIGFIITAELSFRNLRALLIRLYKEKYGEHGNFEKVRDLMKRAGRIEEKRNQITHSLWGADICDNSISYSKITAKEKQGLRSKSVDIKADDLDKIANEIKRLAYEIQDFRLTFIEQK